MADLPSFWQALVSNPRPKMVAQSLQMIFQDLSREKRDMVD
jgi:hypothetical protein